MDRQGIPPACLRSIGLPERQVEDVSLRQTMDSLIAEHSLFRGP